MCKAHPNCVLEKQHFHCQIPGCPRLFTYRSNETRHRREDHNRCISEPGISLKTRKKKGLPPVWAGKEDVGLSELPNRQTVSVTQTQEDQKKGTGTLPSIDFLKEYLNAKEASPPQEGPLRTQPQDRETIRPSQAYRPSMQPASHYQHYSAPSSQHLLHNHYAYHPYTRPYTYQYTTITPSHGIPSPYHAQPRTMFATPVIAGFPQTYQLPTHIPQTRHPGQDFPYVTPPSIPDHV